MSIQSPLGEVIWEGSRRSCAELALSLDAASIAYRVIGRGDSWSVLVRHADLDLALREVDAFLEDQGLRQAAAADRARTDDRDGHPFHFLAISGRTGWVAAVIPYAIVLLIVHRWATTQAWSKSWVELGRVDALLVREGEWWRVVTALTLHADVLHLFGNLIIGTLFVFFLFQYLGIGIGWLSVLLAGAGGNLLNATLQSSSHRSIGASTGVFAALGLLAGCGWVVRRRAGWTRMQRWAPLVGAAVLLGFLGTGGGDPGPSRVDVGAHLCGFAVGCLTGYGLARWSSLPRYALPRESYYWQSTTAAASILVLAGCWYLALTR
ncbi:MAG: rhomboid family intramembrane serine protease [Phycisphaerae bacterium]